jgi:cobalamin biosynthetic protein CobC
MNDGVMTGRMAVAPGLEGRPGVAAGFAPIRHGGDLDEAEATFPGGPRPWVDLSTGINPVAYPLPPLSAEHFARLPGRSELATLETIAAAAYGANQPAEAVAAPGTQALIGLLPRLRARGTVSILGPTYAEHAPAWLQAGHHVVESASLDTLPDADVFLVVNPNNPDGRVLSPGVLRELASRSARRNGWLIVDEAFADLEEMAGLAPDLPDNAILLRSFGKTYGQAGLRLGFAIAHPDVGAELRRVLGPWPLSGPAIAIGRLALADIEWRRAASRARAMDARRLDQAMAAVGGRIVGGTRLFRLYELAGAPALFDHLGRNGIWVRRYQHNPAWLRFGLPASASDWLRLETALRSLSRADSRPEA